MTEGTARVRDRVLAGGSVRVRDRSGRGGSDAAERQARIAIYRHRASRGLDLFTGARANLDAAPLATLMTPEERAALDALADEEQARAAERAWSLRRRAAG